MTEGDPSVEDVVEAIAVAADSCGLTVLREADYLLSSRYRSWSVQIRVEERLCHGWIRGAHEVPNDSGDFRFIRGQYDQT